jgi:DNA-binding transcriptional MerR regulator
MNRVLEQMRKEFQGNADALVLAAQEVVQKLNIAQEASEGNERLVRHYVQVAAVDKPLREGRDAVYGFRHLVQYVATRRLLAEGFPLAKIASYTSAVPTEDLARYLEKTDRVSEAELLVAAFRTEGVTRAGASGSFAKRPPPVKPLPSSVGSMGMVDVMHEMREMEQRTRYQIEAMRKEVQLMFDDATKRLASQMPSGGGDPAAFKQGLRHIAELMDETVERLHEVLKKPVDMIEKQMDQQRYLFDEAYRQKDFLEKMFADVLGRQRAELEAIAQHQRTFLQRFASDMTSHQSTLLKRIDDLEHAIRKQQEHAPSGNRDSASGPENASNEPKT